MGSEKPIAETDAPKSARDELTVLRALTMLAGIIVGGLVGAAVGIEANVVGAIFGFMLGAAIGAGASVSLWS